MFTLMIIVFILGYILIVFEHVNKINKAASALLIGVSLWTIYSLSCESVLSLNNSHSWEVFKAQLQHGVPQVEDMRYFVTHHELFHHLSEISSILFFLIGAMTIVEVVDEYQGFSIITKQIKTSNVRALIWIISIITFFMSALLDNLTTTIILLTLLQKIISRKEFRWIFASLVIMSANAGGAWSPIGDVTTIMLWIGGQITAANIVSVLFFPSLVNMLVVTTILSYYIKGHTIKPQLEKAESIQFTTRKEQLFILIVGAIALISVPVFKTFTHLPPFMGMMLGLGLIWMITDRYLKRVERVDQRKLTVIAALRSIDIPTILFFLGILLGVSALQSAGQLDALAQWLSSHFSNVYIINAIIGVISAIVDNVPLVAASMGMYEIQTVTAPAELQQFVVDGTFWELLAYCAGTGGSILIVGSAAGVAAMGIEYINFVWYMKYMGWIAFVGYLTGILSYYLQSLII